MEESLSHNMGYTPGIFDNIFRWHFFLEMEIYKNKMVTPKNFILQYIGMKNINILKRKCQVGINVVFLN
jgi:hypothetical protein